jgi:LuxR family maltose regulon positive regulatory protein
VTSVRSRATRGSAQGPKTPEIRQLDLRPPALNDGLIEREHLLQRLRASDDARLVALVAPPGYGKTTLMAHWMGSTSRPAAWLTLDPADNDPVGLLSHLWAAFSDAGMVVPDEAALSFFSSRPTTDGMARLIGVLQPGPERGIIFLDNLDA